MKRMKALSTLAAVAFFLGLASSMGFAADSTYGVQKQTTTMESARSATQTTTVTRPGTKSGSWTPYLGSTSTVTGGYNMNSEGQPLPNSSRGSREDTIYHFGVKKTF